jgi:hypothetical protein
MKNIGHLQKLLGQPVEATHPVREYFGSLLFFKVLGLWKMTDLRILRSFLRAPFLTALRAALALAVLSFPVCSRRVGHRFVGQPIAVTPDVLNGNIKHHLMRLFALFRFTGACLLKDLCEAHEAFLHWRSHHMTFMLAGANTANKVLSANVGKISRYPY